MITLQSLAQLPQSTWLREMIMELCTCITGRVTPTDAQQLAPHYPTATADELAELPSYQWWAKQRGETTTTDARISSPPPQLPRRDDH